MSRPEPFKILARPDHYMDGHEVIIRQGEGRAVSMTFEATDVGMLQQPILSGQDGTSFLQAALNCAWEMGMRPIGFHATTDTIKAKDQHLADMRAITFHKLGVEKP